jgi:hypothetical protein
VDVNDVVLYGIIIGGGILVMLGYLAHQQQKKLMEQLKHTKDRLSKLAQLVDEIEKVEYEMHKASVEKVDRRNLDLIMKETLEFINEKQVVVARNR